MSDRYDELRAAAEAATPGPWVAYNRNAAGTDNDLIGWDFEDGQGPPEPMRGVLMGRDMRFVVLARRDVSALLSERDALAERVRVLEGLLAPLVQMQRKYRRGDCSHASAHQAFIGAQTHWNAWGDAEAALSPSPLVEGGR
jgi:hypothetical protein